MIIEKAEVRVKDQGNAGSVLLTLIRKPRGWTYSVDEVSGGEFTLLWREDTREHATIRLRESYPEDTFYLTVLEEGVTSPG